MLAKDAHIENVLQLMLVAPLELLSQDDGELVEDPEQEEGVELELHAGDVKVANPFEDAADEGGHHVLADASEPPRPQRALQQVNELLLGGGAQVLVRGGGVAAGTRVPGLLLPPSVLLAFLRCNAHGRAAATHNLLPEDAAQARPVLVVQGPRDVPGGGLEVVEALLDAVLLALLDERVVDRADLLEEEVVAVEELPVPLEEVHADGEHSPGDVGHSESELVEVGLEDLLGFRDGDHASRPRVVDAVVDVVDTARVDDFLP
mmetsp:Transcript_6036/g.14701  ORF Transcript_6036/g.14701 Transcript_6036/m.14701 type:complete len:262 (-) Transcript_6036:511-1296(-)